MKNRKSGFTIIEVVLVLAIAGLIFLMVFVALPALQRNQRNLQRRQAVDLVAASILSYQKNNTGKLPVRKQGSSYYFDLEFFRRYVDDSCEKAQKVSPQGISNEVPGGGLYQAAGCSNNFKDPDGTTYYIAYMDGANYGSYVGREDAIRDNFVAKFDHIMYIGAHTKCGEREGTVSYAKGERTFAVLMVLEGDSFYCKDNA